jgi:hypothetical protein
MDEGCVAAVPVDTNVDPRTGAFDVLSLRAGKVTEWHPAVVKVKVYNERTGKEEEVMVEKLTTGIIENPFYAVMNARNSTMQRLVRKLNLLDTVDDKLGSSKLDLIIQLPYVVKGELKKKQAEERREALEKQMEGSKLGIGYIDGTEKVTQLNRPIENNLLKQVEYLTTLLLSQLGITQGVLDGSADENTMQNYFSRTVEPIVAAIADEMKFKFLTKTARTQGQSIEYFRDPFRLIPVSQMAEIGDKMRRNEIMTSNEIRQKIGMKPNEDQRADELANPNLAKSKEAEAVKYAVDHAGGGGSASNAPLETNCTVSVDVETGKQIVTTDLTAEELFSAIEAGKFLAMNITIDEDVIRKIIAVDAQDFDGQFCEFSFTTGDSDDGVIGFLSGKLSAEDNVVFRQL